MLQRPPKPDAEPSSSGAEERGPSAATDPVAAEKPDASTTTDPETRPETTQGPESEPATPGFAERGRMRRRARFLRRARELAYRDLGGLVFDLHRFGQRNDALVLAKLDTIGRIDSELRALEAALAERRPVTVLREAGIAACPRCAAIHGSDDRFCPNCGLAMSAGAERPVAGPPAPAATGGAYPGVPTTAYAPATPPTQAQTPTPGPAPAHRPAPTPSSLAPAGPAPGLTDGASGERDRPNAEQPTEIVRPSRRDP